MQEHEGEVEEPLPGAGERFEGGAGTMSDSVDEDPRPPDQRTPPPTLPPEVMGEPDEPGVAKAEVQGRGVASWCAEKGKHEMEMFVSISCFSSSKHNNKPGREARSK